MVYDNGEENAKDFVMAQQNCTLELPIERGKYRALRYTAVLITVFRTRGVDWLGSSEECNWIRSQRPTWLPNRGVRNKPSVEVICQDWRSIYLQLRRSA